MSLVLKLYEIIFMLSKCYIAVFLNNIIIPIRFELISIELNEFIF